MQKLLSRHGLYKQFVANRLTKILKKRVLKIVLCPNLLSKIPDIWWKGPSWIAKNKWPGQPVLGESKESEIEAKIIKNILAATVKQKDLYDLLQNKYKLDKY